MTRLQGPLAPQEAAQTPYGSSFGNLGGMGGMGGMGGGYGFGGGGGMGALPCRTGNGNFRTCGMRKWGGHQLGHFGFLDCTTSIIL